MKKKNILFSLAATLMTCAVAMCGLASCTNEDNIDKKQAVNEARTYTVSIPANIGGGETRAVEFGTSTIYSKFKTTDVINVFWNNGTTWIPVGTLTPDAEGATATLKGDINGSFTGGIGATLRLCYNINSNPYFLYTGQNGSASSASGYDFAIDDVTVTEISGSRVTTTDATFEHLGSMFRQRLSFVDADGTTPISPTPTINSLFIEVGTGPYYTDIAYDFRDGTESTAPISLSGSPLSITSDGDIYFALKFNSGISSSTNMSFTATDTENSKYKCTKSAPSGGFQNGMYYFGSMTLTKQVALYNLGTYNVGYVVGANGNVYGNSSSASSAGTTAVAMIAYVGAIAGVCEHGLAISLDLPLSGTWAEANTYVSGLTAVPYATWRLPTIADWQYMFIGCGATGSYSATPTTLSSAEINAKITAADGTGAVLADCDYWTATESGSAVWSINFSADGNTATFNSGTDKTGSCRPRAVLAF